MWNRKELKEKGKAAYRANRITCIIAAFMLTIVSTAGGCSAPSITHSVNSGNGSNDAVYEYEEPFDSEYDYEDEFEDLIDSFDYDYEYEDSGEDAADPSMESNEDAAGYSTEASEVSTDLITESSEDVSDYSTDTDEEAADLFTDTDEETEDSISESDDEDDTEFYAGSEDDNEDISIETTEYSTSPNAPLIAGIAGIMLLLIILIICAIASLLSIFLLNPLDVGLRKFFTDNAVNPDAGLDKNNVGLAFGNNYGKVVGSMFTTGLFKVLWSLLFVIPGIYKSYAWRLVPYIIGENPGISGKEARDLSADMMKGSKWAAFVLDLSFLGWQILGSLTLGILNIIWTNPYKAATDAELYLTLAGRPTQPRIEADPSQNRAEADPTQPSATLQPPAASQTPEASQPPAASDVEFDVE